MKKLFLALTLALGVVGASHANSYKLDESAIDAAFATSENVSYTTDMHQSLFSSAALPDGEVTMGGYYVRLVFCGIVGLHRSYMGTGGETMWYKYLCFVCANYVALFHDFWAPIVKGEEKFNSMKDNPKFFAWKN